jgi:hypothetical protein
VRHRQPSFGEWWAPEASAAALRAPSILRRVEPRGLAIASHVAHEPGRRLQADDLVRAGATRSSRVRAGRSSPLRARAHAPPSSRAGEPAACRRGVHAAAGHGRGGPPAEPAAARATAWGPCRWCRPESSRSPPLKYACQRCRVYAAWSSSAPACTTWRCAWTRSLARLTSCTSVAAATAAASASRDGGRRCWSIWLRGSRRRSRTTRCCHPTRATVCRCRTRSPLPNSSASSSAAERPGERRMAVRRRRVWSPPRKSRARRTQRRSPSRRRERQRRR